jgi:hypothetical protein
MKLISSLVLLGVASAEAYNIESKACTGLWDDCNGSSSLSTTITPSRGYVFTHSRIPTAPSTGCTAEGGACGTPSGVACYSGNGDAACPAGSPDGRVYCTTASLAKDRCPERPKIVPSGSTHFPKVAFVDTVDGNPITFVKDGTSLLVLQTDATPTSFTADTRVYGDIGVVSASGGGHQVGGASTCSLSQCPFNFALCSCSCHRCPLPPYECCRRHTGPALQ